MHFLKVTFPSFIFGKLETKSDKRYPKKGTPFLKSRATTFTWSFSLVPSHGKAHCCKSRKLVNLKKRQGEKKETHKRNAPQVSCLWMMWPKSWATKETWSITHVLLKTLMVTINVSYSGSAKRLIYDWVTNIKENAIEYLGIPSIY